jgi:hypothetical protein
MIWPHGPEKLSDFLDNLNSIHSNILFTMETEDGHLPFMDTDIHITHDSSLGHNFQEGCSRLAQKSRCTGRIREVVEISTTLPASKLLVHTLKEWREILSKNRT